MKRSTVKRSTLLVCGALLFTVTCVDDREGLSSLAGLGGPPLTPAGNLDQCANGGVGDPPEVCTGSAWVNGNLNHTKAHYVEGQSVPYRLRMTDVSTSGPHTVTIEWDVTKSGEHATDYVTSFDRTETTADPCSGVSGCAGPPDLFPIPVDANVTNGQNGVDDAPVGPTGGDDITQIPGDFALFNGDITGVSVYTTTGSLSGDASTRITITFTASATNPVLAWGGHIGTRLDWGFGNSAIAIPGSPYHTSCQGIDGNTGCGSQDRSLSASATIFPATLTIIKNAEPDDPTDFSFSTTGPELSSFSLDDDGTPLNPLSNTKVFSLTSFGAGNTRTVTEADPAPAFLLTAPFVCTEASGGAPQTDNSTTDLATRTATIIAEEGELITCTYINTQQAATLKVIKHVINDNGGTRVAADFTLDAGGTNDTPDDFAGVEGPTGTTVTLDPGAYNVTETGPGGYSASFSADCSGTLGAGETKTCTVTNDDLGLSLTLVKDVINDNGGDKTPADWTLSAAGPTPISGAGGATSGAGFTAGVYTLSESGPGGYAASAWVCVLTGRATQPSPTTVAVGLSGQATCTITNDDVAPSLTLVKEVTNDNGGQRTPADWTLDAAGPTPISGAGGATSGAGFTAGVYTLSESGPGGYAASAWVCVLTGRATQPSPTTVAVGLGGSATCTITNDDLGLSLTLVKDVINDNGGDKTPADWTLSAAGPTPISGAGGATSGAGFTAGVYTLSESGPGGYAASAWVCVLTGRATQPSPTTVAVGLSGHATCTTTNDDVAPSLTLVKVVDNSIGGTAVPSDWTLTADGVGVDNDFSGPGPTVSSGLSFDAGTYDLSESIGAGLYDPSDWVCTSGQVDGNTVAVGLGDDITCTITNTHFQAQATLGTVPNPTSGIVGVTLLNDVATFDGASPTGLGTITFKLFSPGTCPGGAPFGTQSFPVGSNGSYSTTPGFIPNVAGTWSWTAEFTGDVNNLPIPQTDCILEQVSVTNPVARLTPGYWKNHETQATAVLPQTLGGFTVGSFPTATAVFAAMNCGKSTSQDAVGCLAGHLLAAKLNVANGAGADACVTATIAAADAFLTSINYVGPTGTYALTPSQRSTAISLKSTLDRYNNNLSCP